MVGDAARYLPTNGLFLLYGHTAVAIFIVISGYVLSIPLARRSSFAIDPIQFMKRRMRRLLPAYYAAVALSVPLYFVVLKQMQTSTSLAHFAVQLATHLILLHNVFRQTVYGISTPLWSVATEMQIYVVFCVLLLPLQKRFGLLISTLLILLLGLVPTALADVKRTAIYNLEPASLWLVGLFAAGSAAAWIAYGPAKYDNARNLPWKIFSILGFALFIALIAPDYGSTAEHPNPMQDIAVGIGVACGFVAVAIDQRANRRSLTATFFSLPPFVFLGTFSYSLYLIHGTIIEAFTRWSLRFRPADRLELDSALLVTIVVGAYLFARIFEFPFISASRRANDRLALEGMRRSSQRAGS